MTEYRTICILCAKKSIQRKNAYLSSNHRVLPDMGPDSVCDFCGIENGGAVIQVKFIGHDPKCFPMKSISDY